MANLSSCIADIHLWDGVGTADVIQHQRLARECHASVFCLASNGNCRAEGIDATVLGDGLSVNVCRVIGAVDNHLAACIQVLCSTCKGDTGKFAVRRIAVHDRRRVEVGNVATKRTRDPLHLCIATNDGALSVEVVHVLGPVFDGRVAQTSAVLNKELNSACVKVCCVVLRCRTALNKVQISAFLNNNKRVLKLASTLSVQPKVALKWVVQSDVFGHINKRTARPHGIVQRRKLVV